MTIKEYIKFIIKKLNLDINIKFIIITSQMVCQENFWMFLWQKNMVGLQKKILSKDLIKQLKIFKKIIRFK